mmetsp:Transcript_24465/g.39161  ORF Transcript_24465/g.39161 Transcript_24465/m.39161 type:complete len:288 (-) Transcript_24465:533-1396(-)
MARSHVSTIEHVLNRQLDIDSLCLSCNLDTISQSRNRAMCPTRPTILWNVLIQRDRTIVNTRLIAPRKLCGVRSAESLKFVVGRIRRRISVPNNTEFLYFFAGQQFAFPCLRCAGVDLAGLFRGIAIRSIFIALVLIVFFGRGVIVHHCPCTRLLQCQSAMLHADVTLFAPILTPRISNNPIEAFFLVSTPSHHRNDMICHETETCRNASLIVFDGSCINSACNRTPIENFFLHRCLSRNGTVIRDRHVGVVRESDALLPECPTSSSNVQGVAIPFCILAKAFRAFA